MPILTFGGSQKSSGKLNDSQSSKNIISAASKTLHLHQLKEYAFCEKLMKMKRDLAEEIRVSSSFLDLLQDQVIQQLSMRHRSLLVKLKTLLQKKNKDLRAILRIPSHQDNQILSVI